MIETNNETEAAVEPLSHEAIPELINASGPCVTLVLPPYRPGEPGESAAALLKTDLKDVARKLAARKVAGPLVTELLEPLRQLSHEEEALAGSAFPRVIFRSQGAFRQFE